MHCSHTLKIFWWRPRASWSTIQGRVWAKESPNNFNKNQDYSISLTKASYEQISQSPSKSKPLKESKLSSKHFKEKKYHSFSKTYHIFSKLSLSQNSKQAFFGKALDLICFLLLCSFSFSSSFCNNYVFQYNFSLWIIFVTY